MSKVKRHAVTIKRPSTTIGDRGQITGDASTVAEDVPCSIEPLSGRELELAKQIVANATQRVTFYVGDEWKLTTKDFIVFGTRELNIGHISYADEVEFEAVCLCAEAVS